MNKNQVEKVIWWALKNLLGNLWEYPKVCVNLQTDVR